MYLMFTVACLCGVVLIGGLARLACRHRAHWWITSDDAILCVVSPVVILLLTGGGVSLGYRLMHGGLAAVPAGGWVGSAVILAASAVLWLLGARWIRGRGFTGAPGMP
jgi:hypothetical protein